MLEESDQDVFEKSGKIPFLSVLHSYRFGKKDIGKSVLEIFQQSVKKKNTAKVQSRETNCFVLVKMN